MAGTEETTLAEFRNFSIIAHIDHGKTTLSDRLLQATDTVADREMTDQLLDSMDLEKERGITIKSHPVTMRYHARDGKSYVLNLLDTPGHVDFSYEVSRSLAACEGALLLVDAAQGVEAQTVANAHLAAKLDLVIIPVINKIDLPAADVPRIQLQLEDILALPREETIQASAKAGIGIEDILEAIVERIPPPVHVEDDGCLRGMIFDSVFDSYRGVIVYVRVKSGVIRRGQQIRLMSTEQTYEVKEVGVFTPKMLAQDALYSGGVGYFIANIKSTADVKVGDTVTEAKGGAPKPLPGFQEIQPMVYSGIYPLNSADFEHLKAAMGKLQLNDPAFVYQAESSAALGFGFRCGFLGLLHLEIIQERLRREYDMDIISTYPSVVYKVHQSDGKVLDVDNPMHLPDPSYIAFLEEPMVKCFILTPADYLGEVMGLVREKRGQVENTETLDASRLILAAILPLNEIVVDFVDKLKSLTKGYASMDYEYSGYQASNLVKLDILVNGESVDAFSAIVHRDKAEFRGRQLVAKLKEVIPRQLFRVALQAAIGAKIIAREDISALRKNVTAKCYGGDITRKRKLLEKQKEGKKRMKAIGKVSIPQDAFIEVLKS